MTWMSSDGLLRPDMMSPTLRSGSSFVRSSKFFWVMSLSGTATTIVGVPRCMSASWEYALQRALMTCVLPRPVAPLRTPPPLISIL